LDLLFEKGVSARKFATTQVDVFDQDIDGEFMSKYHQQTQPTKEVDTPRVQ
jgi:SP family general alpha glucoside:H+ symporter-like MFS transporter